MFFAIGIALVFFGWLVVKIMTDEAKRDRQLAYLLIQGSWWVGVPRIMMGLGMLSIMFSVGSFLWGKLP